jgi:hypothetical protein
MQFAGRQITQDYLRRIFGLGNVWLCFKDNTLNLSLVCRCAHRAEAAGLRIVWEALPTRFHDKGATQILFRT